MQLCKQLLRSAYAAAPATAVHALQTASHAWTSRSSCVFGSSKAAMQCSVYGGLIVPLRLPAAAAPRCSIHRMLNMLLFI